MTAIGALAVAEPVMQEPPGRPPQEGWRVDIGLGTIAAPAYVGADEIQLLAVPSIAVAYGERFTFSVQDGARYSVVKRRAVEAGGFVRYDFGRPEDGANPFRISGDQNDDLEGLGDLEGTPEAGGYLTIRTRSLALSTELRQGLGGGHEGLVGETSLRLVHRFTLGDSMGVVSAGPQAKWASTEYIEAFFGIDSLQSAASGLPIYAPEGGLLSYGVGGVLVIPLPFATATLVASYSELQGDAAEAPLVSSRGDARQSSVGLFFSWRL